MARIEKQWTLIWHTGWTETQHVEFERAVQSSPIRSTVERRAVLLAGGLVFEEYAAAEDFAEAVNYPPSVQGLIPFFDGQIVPTQINGLSVYVPTDAERERYNAANLTLVKES